MSLLNRRRKKETVSEKFLEFESDAVSKESRANLCRTCRGFDAMDERIMILLKTMEERIMLRLESRIDRLVESRLCRMESILESLRNQVSSLERERENMARQVRFRGRRDDSPPTPPPKQFLTRMSGFQLLPVQFEPINRITCQEGFIRDQSLIDLLLKSSVDSGHTLSPPYLSLKEKETKGMLPNKLYEHYKQPRSSAIVSHYSNVAGEEEENIFFV